MNPNVCEKTTGDSALNDNWSTEGQQISMGKQPRDNKGRYGPLHAAKSAKIAERYSDLRTKEGRTLKAILGHIVSDLGGEGSLNGKQRLLLDTLRAKLIVILQISDYADLQFDGPGIITKDGDLIPCLGKSYLAYTNSIRLTLRELYEGWDGGKPPKTLED